MQKLVLFAALFTSVFICPAQMPTHAAIDSIVNVEMQRQKIPGVSIAIIKDGRVEYIKGYGFSNLEHEVKTKPETVFQLGSIGKQFAAFAVMLLVEEGKISLEDRLTRFFPDAPASWDSITIRNLLTHTSGLGEYPRDFNFRADYTEDSLYQIIKTIPLEFKAGEKSRYSNMGYVTLGIIISKASGMFYGDYLQQRVFNPLGMSATRIISEKDIIPNRASGYVLENERIKHQRWVSPTINTTADGSIYSTAVDMAKWEAALNAQKLLHPGSYKSMWSPVKLNDGSTYPYGFGWALDSINGKLIIQHGGSWQGFEAFFMRYPEQKFTVMVFANLSWSSPYKIAVGIRQLYHPELVKAKLKPIKDTEPQITKLAKEFINKVIDQSLAAEMLTPEFGEFFLPIVKEVSQYLKSHGSLKNLELLEKKSLENGARSYHYRINFTGGVSEMLLTLTKENKISGLEGRE